MPRHSTVTSTKVISAVTNRYQGLSTRPAFTFNNGAAPGNLSTITSVQLDMFVNPTPTLAAAETELRSAAYLRNQLRAPVSLHLHADGLGRGAAERLHVVEPRRSGSLLHLVLHGTRVVSLGRAPWPAASGGLVDWHPGAGTYTVSLTVTDTSGLAATYSQSVTVT